MEYSDDTCNLSYYLEFPNGDTDHVSFRRYSTVDNRNDNPLSLKKQEPT